MGMMVVQQQQQKQKQQQQLLHQAQIRQEPYYSILSQRNEQFFQLEDESSSSSNFSESNRGIDIVHPRILPTLNRADMHLIHGGLPASGPPAQDLQSMNNSMDRIESLDMIERLALVLPDRCFQDDNPFEPNPI